jgi:hypothetical protein
MGRLKRAALRVRAVRVRATGKVDHCDWALVPHQDRNNAFADLTTRGGDAGGLSKEMRSWRGAAIIPHSPRNYSASFSGCVTSNAHKGCIEKTPKRQELTKT